MEKNEEVEEPKDNVTELIPDFEVEISLEDDDEEDL